MEHDMDVFKMLCIKGIKNSLEFSKKKALESISDEEDLQEALDYIEFIRVSVKDADYNWDVE